VAVTGLGIVSSVGSDLDRFFGWLCEGEPAPVRTPVQGFDPAAWLTAKQIRRSDPFARYAVAAARLAFTDGGAPAVPPARAGVVFGNAYGGTESLAAEAALLASDGPEAVSPFLAVAALEASAPAMVSIDLGWQGPSKIIATACASGTHAVGEAADLIRFGRCDVAVAGGTQGRITDLLMASYRNLRVLSTSGWVRPFDRRRDGFVFAEGAAALLLEPLDAAVARGARVYAEVLGWGHTSDGVGMVSPSGDGAVACIEAAIADAGIAPDDLVHVNAHGTGTLRNDEVEAQSLHRALGRRPPAVTSIKRLLGHAAAAAGAFEAVTAALAVHHGLAPSLGTDVEPDPDLDLDLVIGPPRRLERGPVLSTSLGLGGHNGALVLGPAD
jgi:3-oxoacyl-[acyl-carrier-protein] synthase II